MKVTFVCPGDELLGIGYMSSVLKENGIETELVFDPRLFEDSLLQKTFLARMFKADKDAIVKRIIDTGPDLVAITSTTNTVAWGFEVAEKLKKLASNMPVIFGGPHVTAVPEKVINKEYVDYICVGPGEYALLDLVKAIQSGNNDINIPGIWHKKENEVVRNEKIYITEDIDQIPFPDKDLFFSQLPFYKDPYTIVSSRGCPFSCTYCMANVYHHLYQSCDAKSYQRRSVKNVIDELAIAKEKWNIKSVKFFDDLFAVNKRWLKEFAEEYRSKINLPFRCSVHPGALDQEIVETLKYAGAYTITMGVQTVNEDILKGILKRNTSFNKIQSSMELLRESKIYYSVDHIFGLPDETEEDHKKGALLYSKVRPNNILLYWLVYYPKTEIIRYALDRKLIDQTDIDLIEEGKGNISYKSSPAQKEHYHKSHPYYIMYNLIPVKIIPRFVFSFVVKHDLARFFNLPFFVVIIKQFFDSLDPRSSRNEQIKKTISFLKHGRAFNRKNGAVSKFNSARIEPSSHKRH